MGTQAKDRMRSAGTLVSRVSEALRQSILNGEYVPGEKLPSEAQLTEAHGVSRTVVREAVAALRYDGLVEARQGAGVFVLDPSSRPSFSPRHTDRARLSSDLEILEIRTPVEVEAAGLAALRRSPAQEEAIFDCHARVLACIEANRPIREADFALHQAIAEATNNPLFAQFLQAQGTAVIPQSRILSDSSDEAETAYRRLIHKEHEAIVLAISNGDEEAARNAMRDHLKGSQVRHRKLLRDGRFRSPAND